MSYEPFEERTPEEARVRALVRALDLPPADPVLRARLRQQFVAGTIEGAERRPARILPFPWLRSAGGRWLTAAAAALIVVMTVLALDRGPAWTLLTTSGVGIVIVDGVPVPLEHREELARALRPGVRVRVPEGAAIEVANPGNLVVQITGGTDATIPEAPGRWFGRRIHAGIEAGELRITTGPRFAGAHLALSSPEAEVLVKGTTLAVIREPGGTCVCVFEGVVRVGEKSGPMVEVEHGHRRFVFNDGRDPEMAEIREAEVAKLGEFRDQRSEWLAKPR